MVVGGHFWHDNNRQTTIAPTLCILPKNPTCLNAESSPIWDEPEKLVTHSTMKRARSKYSCHSKHTLPP
jgi:hypothetical protein